MINLNTPSDELWNTLSDENAIYYPDTFASNSMPTCFCYYETASSLGLFMPGFNADSEMNSVMIFTPHFFQRYAERMGIS